MLVEMANLYPKNKHLKIDLATAVAQVIGSGHYIGGTWVANFEQEWANYCGAKYCVGVSSGFAALQLTLRALAISQVHYPTMTCMPTVLAIEEAGCDPVPIIPSEGMYTLEQCQLAEGLNVFVNLYGIIDPEVYEKDGIHIVEDAAQAHGAHYRMCNRAALTTAAAWSFYPTKNLGAMGDAGAVTTNDEGLARVVRSLSNYGGRGAINARLDPLQAAILCAKLPYLNSHNHRRAANATLYLEKLKGYPLELLYTDLTNWHQFPVLSDERDKLKEWLANHGIESQVHYERPAITSRRLRKDIPWDVWWSKKVLSLPVGPHLNEANILHVLEVIDAFYNG
jgi:dTDP-4-amino-4,6-dideoxygalactose transaminase